MAHFGIGLTQGPNGPQMSPVLMLTPSAPSEPESYESNFETPEGVHVKITYNTKNKVAADRYEDELAQKMDWKVLEQEPAGPETLGSKIGTSWLVAIVVPFVVGIAAMFIAMLLNIAGYIGFSTVNNVMSHAVRYGLWSVPIIGLILTSVAIFTHSSDNQHV